MDILKASIILFIIILAIFMIGIGIGMLKDYRKTKEIELLMYGIALPSAATLMLYLFFYTINF
jgi:hypothetical protein